MQLILLILIPNMDRIFSLYFLSIISISKRTIIWRNELSGNLSVIPKELEEEIGNICFYINLTSTDVAAKEQMVSWQVKIYFVLEKYESWK